MFKSSRFLPFAATLALHVQKSDIPVQQQLKRDVTHMAEMKEIFAKTFPRLPNCFTKKSPIIEICENK